MLLVDDDALVRAGLSMMLHGADGLVIVGEAGDGDQVPGAVARHRPDVVLMDLRMPRVDGIAATRRLRAGPRPPEVIVLTTFDADENVVGALRAGASGFLLKDSPPGEIAEAIRRVAAGDPMLSPAVTRRLMRRAVVQEDARQRALRQLEGLSPREREVVSAIAEGQTNAEIAAVAADERAHRQGTRDAHPDQGGAGQQDPDRAARARRRPGPRAAGLEWLLFPVRRSCRILVRWNRQLIPSGGRSARRGPPRAGPPPAGSGPSDQALHWLAGWYAIALRLGGAVLFTAVAVLAATRQVSGWWLSAPLTGLCRGRPSSTGGSGGPG